MPVEFYVLKFNISIRCCPIWVSAGAIGASKFNHFQCGSQVTGFHQFEAILLAELLCNSVSGGNRQTLALKLGGQDFGQSSRWNSAQWSVASTTGTRSRLGACSVMEPIRNTSPSQLPFSLSSKGASCRCFLEIRLRCPIFRRLVPVTGCSGEFFPHGLVTAKDQGLRLCHRREPQMFIRIVNRHQTRHITDSLSELISIVRLVPVVVDDN